MYRKIFSIVLCAAAILWFSVNMSDPVNTETVCAAENDNKISSHDEGSEEPVVSASAAVLYCADSGEVIWEKNAHEHRAIASITKIMTAVIALEKASAEDIDVKIDRTMYAEGSSMYLKEGEIIKLSELVKGLMMVSGNDAANAIAKACAGNSAAFADLMNIKAKQIGMNDTHFVTPSGLDDESHYSTAYDMALLCSYAMENVKFTAIVSQKQMEISYVFPENKTQICVNHNKLLSVYNGCTGVKTGFTKKAGRTLTSSAQRDGISLIAVTLNDPDDWADHCKMFDYGFSRTERVRMMGRCDGISVDVVGGKQDTVNAVPEIDCDVTITDDTDRNSIIRKIYMPRFVYAPIKKGDIIGEIVFLNGKKEIFRCFLKAGSDVDYDG